MSFLFSLFSFHPRRRLYLSICCCFEFCLHFALSPDACNRCALAIIALLSRPFATYILIAGMNLCLCVCCCLSMEMKWIPWENKQLTAISDKSHSALVANDYHGNGNGNHTSRTASSARASSTVRVSIEQDQHFLVQRIVRHCKVVETIPNNFYLKL